MSARQFIESVLPDTGYIITGVIDRQGHFKNVPHRTIDGAIETLNHAAFEGKAAYFALASYERERYRDAKGEWVSRTQENAMLMRSFFLDLDVDPSNTNKFASKDAAITALRDFGIKLGLPRPTIVDSGGGYHIYWPLVTPVSTKLWRAEAERFKNICAREQLKADPSVTSDEARVLRLPGTFNHKRGAAVRLIMSCANPITFTDFTRKLDAHAAAYGESLPARPRKTVKAAPIPGDAPADIWGDQANLEVVSEPLNFDRIVFHCAQLQQQAGNRGATTGEQLWRAGLGLVKFSDKAELAARFISDAHPDFSMSATQAKLDNWSTGPSTCEHFHQLNPALCESCPHYGKITSPAQLGRHIVEAAAPRVVITTDAGVTSIELPQPPTGYKRRASDGAVIQEYENKEGQLDSYVICPYDLYPLAVRTQSEVDANIDERSTWRMHLPVERGLGTTIRDIDVPLGLLADSRALIKLLFSKGLILLGEQVKSTQLYMSAYLQSLVKANGRDKLYERLGWHDDHKTFVLADKVLFADSTSRLHNPNEAIKNSTKNGLKAGGTLEGWKAAMQFYNRPNYAGHRMFLYASFGSIIFEMNDTGHRGVIMAASGKSGRGKTTCLQACSSVWGRPDALVINGNKEGATVNALYSALGTTHSLPFMLDDTTERDVDEKRRFLLNFSQGEGKRRMTAGAEQSGKVDRWACIGLMTTNTDDISAMVSSGRDVDPHMMRMINVEFVSVDNGTEAKIVADEFIRSMNANYGHAGPLFAKFVTENYAAVQRGFIKNVAKVDRLLNSSNASAERFWSACVAACYTAAQIASALGLIELPYEEDLEWMIAHLTRHRETIKESNNTPLETLTEFLNGYMRNTLIISAKSSTNLDNVVVRHTDALQVRHELDFNLIYIARGAIMEFCADAGIPFKTLEWDLERAGVITQRNAQKVLGADTVYSNGQSRCWRIDSTKLGGYVAPLHQVAPPTNVVSIGAKTA